LTVRYLLKKESGHPAKTGASLLTKLRSRVVLTYGLYLKRRHIPGRLAMAAGITKKRWTVRDIVLMLEDSN